MEQLKMCIYLITTTPPNNLIAWAFLCLAGIAIVILFTRDIITWIANKREKIENRDDFFKAISILIVSSLSLLANNAWAYGATIFIIASLMTENAFLENLAAIFRGGDYFKYKTESKSSSKSNQSIGTIAKTLRDMKNLVPDRANDKTAKMELINKLGYQEFETLGIEYLSKTLNLPIEHQTKISRNNKSIELDGFVDKKFRENNTHLCIEIKKYRNSIPSSNDLARIANDVAVRVEEITGEFAETILLVIYDPESENIAKSRKTKTDALAASSRFINKIIWLSVNDLFDSGICDDS